MRWLHKVNRGAIPLILALKLNHTIITSKLQLNSTNTIQLSNVQSIIMKTGKLKKLRVEGGTS